MTLLRTYRRVYSCVLLLVILTGWFVMPLGTWVPKLLGWEHAVSVGLDHCDLHLAIIHADGSVDHDNHGPDCPGHPVPEGTSDHNKHGVHMPQMERETSIGIPIPSPAIRISPLPFQLGDQTVVDVVTVPDDMAPGGYLSPTELQKTTVLLI